MTELTHAIVGGPPTNWRDLIIRDLDSGAELRNVVEVDTVAGWVRQHAVDKQGRAAIDRTKGEYIVLQRCGRFSIEVKAA